MNLIVQANNFLAVRGYSELMLKDVMRLPIILNENISGQETMAGVYGATQMCT